MNLSAIKKQLLFAFEFVMGEPVVVNSGRDFFFTGLVYLTVYTMLSDRQIQNEEMEVFANMICNVFPERQEVVRSQLEKDVDRQRSIPQEKRDQECNRYCHTMVNKMSHEKRKLVMAYIKRIIMADGIVTESEQQAWGNMQLWLEI